MRLILLVSALLVVGCTREPAHTVTGAPIAMVNPVLGDSSFIVRFGRLPTDADDARVRVQTHLAYAEELLRARTVAPALQPARTRALDALHRYWVAGEFPAGESPDGMLPTFIDDRGVRCAVAFLVEDTAGSEVITTIDRRYHNAWIAQIDAPALAAWAASTGFTHDELAMIQPAYPPKPPSKIDVTLWTGYRYKIADDVRYLARVVEPGTDDVTHVASVGAGVRSIRDHNRWLGSPILGLDGSIGTADGDELAYSAFLRLGSQVSWHPFSNGNAHTMGVLAGLGIDRIGAQIERAWTVPVDAFWYGKVGSDYRLGIGGGPRFTVGGADRSLGWRAGVDLVKRDLTADLHWLGLRDVGINLGVERISDATFVGVTLAIASRSNHGWYSRD